MMIAIQAHYVEAIPKLMEEFNQFYEETKSLSPTEKRLVILKLIHFKNVEIPASNKNQCKKIDSLVDESQNRVNDNRAHNNDGNQGGSPGNRYDGPNYQPRPSRRAHPTMICGANMGPPQAR